MTAATKVSACVDCATTIIGARLRCPACHDLHASRFSVELGDDAGDDAATVPHPRQRVRVVNRARGELTAGYFTRRVVAIEVLGIVGLALVLLVKECLR